MHHPISIDINQILRQAESDKGNNPTIAKKLIRQFLKISQIQKLIFPNGRCRKKLKIKLSQNLKIILTNYSKLNSRVLLQIDKYKIKA